MKGKKLTEKEKKQKLMDEKSYRRRIFSELLKHLEKGLSLDCFAELSEQTILEHCERYPEEFVKEKIIESGRKAKEMWETIGYQQSKGQCLGNSRSWVYNMINRYGWTDKTKIEQEVKGEVKVNIINYASKNTSPT
jgi:hypothetical protein